MKYLFGICILTILVSCTGKLKSTISQDDIVKIEKNCLGLYSLIEKGWKKNEKGNCYKFNWELIRYLEDPQNKECLTSFSTTDIEEYFGQHSYKFYSSILPEEKVKNLKEEILVYEADTKKDCIYSNYTVSFYYNTKTNQIISFGYLQKTID